MFTIDRYLLGSFFKVLTVCFVSFTGLYVLIDVFGNLDEFIRYGAAEGGLLKVLAEYYSPRVLSFFDRTSGLLALIAAMFTLAQMQRTSEITALSAAGIPYWRIVRPLIFGAIVVSILGVVNREWLIPQQRGSLVRNAQNWLGDSPQPLRPQWDNKTNVLLGGESFLIAKRRIVNPKFLLPESARAFGRQLAGQAADFQEAAQGRPQGYLFTGLKQPKNPAGKPSVYEDGAPLLLSPADTPWLQDGQLFLVSDIGFDELSGGPLWRSLSSTMQIAKALRNPSFDFGADTRVTLHARLVQPFLDVVLLFLGLPLAFSQRQQSPWAMAGMTILMVAGFQGVLLVSHSLGVNYLFSPTFAAWLPLMIFAPLAMQLARLFRI